MHNHRMGDDFAELLMSPERKKWQDPETILDQIRVDGKIDCADLGCGPGFFTLPLVLRMGESSTVYAVDQSDVMLEHLVKNLKNSLPEKIVKKVKVIQADVTHTTIPDSSVGFVIFAQLF